MGSMASLLVVLGAAPPATSLASDRWMIGAMSAIGTWIFLPSLAVTLVSGLLAIGLNRAYHNAGWAFVKLATGVLIFESGLVGVLGPIQDEAERSAGAVASPADTTLAGSLALERNTLWVLLAVGVMNVALAIWRPRLTRLKD